jgi:mannose-6-phosphate isomerase-like protein (cupin superfamily)
MEIIVNEAAPQDSVDRYTSKITSTGEEIIDVPPHWHKNHQEYISVLEGRVEMTIGGTVSILNAGDPPAVIPRRVVHSFKSFKGERLVVCESPDPPGLYKGLFFNDLFAKGTWGGFFYNMRVFYDGDAYIALPLGSRWLDELFISVFGGLARFFVAGKPKSL